MSKPIKGRVLTPEPPCPKCGRGRVEHERRERRDEQGRRVVSFDCPTAEKGRTPPPCPPCDDPLGHQYDDDRYSLLYGLDDWSRLGDPCIWCDHEKCKACPPPRGGTFDEEHAAGREICWNECCAEQQ